MLCCQHNCLYNLIYYKNIFNIELILLKIKVFYYEFIVQILEILVYYCNDYLLFGPIRKFVISTNRKRARNQLTSVGFNTARDAFVREDSASVQLVLCF